MSDPRAFIMIGTIATVPGMAVVPLPGDDRVLGFWRSRRRGIKSDIHEDVLRSNAFAQRRQGTANDAKKNHTTASLHLPRRKAIAATTASSDSAPQIARYTPRGPRPACVASVHANGNWNIQ